MANIQLWLTISNKNGSKTSCSCISKWKQKRVGGRKSFYLYRQIGIFVQPIIEQKNNTDAKDTLCAQFKHITQSSSEFSFCNCLLKWCETHENGTADGSRSRTECVSSFESFLPLSDTLCCSHCFALATCMSALFFIYLIFFGVCHLSSFHLYHIAVVQ